MSGVLDRHATLVAAALFAGSLAWVGAGLNGPGITWDEPAYFASSQLQVLWAKKLVAEGPRSALAPDTVKQMWDWDHYHNPHPPIYKEGPALTWWATRGVLGQPAAYRLWPAILFAAMIALAFRWGGAAWGGLGGLGAALAILLQPRLFGHAHLAATETPLTVFWFATAAAVWWAVERRWRWGWVLAGLAWGLAAGSKFPGVAAFGPPLLWALWRDRRATLRGAPVALACALAAFALLNPLIWVEPLAWTRTWLWESLHRGDYAPISTWYLGRIYGFDVPWHHVFVMTAAVVPLGILAVAGLGAGAGVRDRDPLAILALGSVAFFWIVMLTPRAPHHNGVRQFLPLFPFLGLLAGRGLALARERLDGRAAALVLLLVVLPPAASILEIRPWYLSYYGEIVGGIPGAHARGFETTYWMDVLSGEPMDWMNENLPRGARVLVLGQEKSLELQQAYGRLRRDLRITGEPPADYYVVPMAQFVIRPELRRALAEVAPLYRLDLQGVPLLAVYRMGGEDRGP